MVVPRGGFFFDEADITQEEALFMLGQGIAEATKKKATFIPGGDNIEFFASEQAAGLGQVLDSVGSSILRGLGAYGKAVGQSSETMFQFFDSNWRKGGQEYVAGLLEMANDPRLTGGADIPGIATGDAPVQDMGFYTDTTEGYNILVASTWRWFNQQAPIDLGEFRNIPTGGGGGGRRGPSAQDIRNRFDLDQLSEVADTIWRGMLLEDTPDSRSMARAYVDAVVAGKGEVTIDFKEFIRQRAMKTDRFAAVYTNLPPSLSPEQYIAPYMAAAQQVARPNAAAGIAIGGAQFGSDAATFAARLRRTDEATSSSSFINELQGRMSGLSGLFRG